jgi:hypothetical protein
MGNRTPNLGIPIPYPRSANVDELFDWERFLHDAFMKVDSADILFTSRIRVAGNRPLADLLSELSTDGGGLLYFPAGTYEVGSTLTVPANVRLLGNNAVLRPSSSFYNSGDNPMFSVAGNGVIFEGLTFQGHTSNSDVRVSAIATNGYETTVSQCRFLRMGYTAVDHRSTTRAGVLRIRDSRFEDCWGDCILTNLSLDADSVVFTHPSTSISTVAAYRGYGVGIKASTQAGQTLRMVLRNVEFDRLLRTAILLTANPSHPAYEVRINGVKVREIGLTRFSNPSGEASAISNDESLYGALIYVKSTSATEEDIGTVHITDFDVDEPYGFVVRFPANNNKRHYLSKGRYKHGASGWSGSSPFNPISLRFARAFVSDVEGNAFKRHFSKETTAVGSYDVVFQNCRFSGAGDFGGSHTDNIWYINCTFSGTAPAPSGRWFIGCSGASQYRGDRVIASDGGHFGSSSLHLDTFQSGLCFKTTASGGLQPKILASGRLVETHIRQVMLIPTTAFLRADNDNTTTLTPAYRLYQLDGIIAHFDDENRLPNGQHRRIMTAVALPYDLWVPMGTTDSQYSLRLRIVFSFSGGRSDLVPIRVRVSLWRHDRTAGVMKVLHNFNPITVSPIDANDLYTALFILPPSELENYTLLGGSIFIDISRRYATGESEIVRVHAVELSYPTILTQ